MTVSIPLSAEAEAKLRSRAAAAGKDVTTFVREAVEEKLEARPTFREIFAPLHEAFQQTDMSEEEIATLFEQLRDQVWREKQSAET